MTIRFKLHEALFALFLAFVLVRVIPFTPRVLDDPDTTGDYANLIRQGVYIAFFVALALLAYRDAWKFVRSLPISFALLMAYTGLSLAWSAVPLVAGPRWILALLVALTIFFASARMRPRTTLEIARWVALTLSLATLIAGLVYPAGAIHQPGDPESSIVGAWRGIFYHKNLAGAVVGLALVLSVEALVRQRRLLRDGAAVLLAGGVLFLTGSRTSEIAALAAIVILFVFRAANVIAARSRIWAALLQLSVIAAIGAIVLLVWFQADLQSYVLDPEAFTGRGYLWGLIVQLIEKRPLLGYGYESVFLAGDDSALMQLAPAEWIRRVPHSHNGPLDLLVSIGAVGLVLYAWAMVVDPWRKLARMPAILREEWQPIIAALLCYVLTRSLMEGKMMSADTAEWPIFVLILGVVTRIGVVIGTGFDAAAGAAGGFRGSRRSGVR